MFRIAMLAIETSIIIYAILGIDCNLGEVRTNLDLARSRDGGEVRRIQPLQVGDSGPPLTLGRWLLEPTAYTAHVGNLGFPVLARP